MTASNYLPPFDADDRTVGPDTRTEADDADLAPPPTSSATPAPSTTAAAAASAMTRTDAEVTYADFLGDQVED